MLTTRGNKDAYFVQSSSSSPTLRFFSYARRLEIKNGQVPSLEIALGSRTRRKPGELGKAVPRLEDPGIRSVAVEPRIFKAPWASLD